jgi:hypothetical protein
VRGILADINVAKQARAIVSIWTSEVWLDIWNGLQLSVESFPALGLSYDSSDAVIWRACQKAGPILITTNRNADDVDSLEAVIRSENRFDSLPVITIADPDRVLRDRGYAEQVAEQMLDYLMRVDEFRGCGRLYAP